jgi:hypothetical protein
LPPGPRDDGADVGGHLPAGVEREPDVRQAVAGDLQRFDLPDPDPGDPHVVADVQGGRVAEGGAVEVGPAHAGVGDGDREQDGRGRGDQDEDQALDERAGEVPHLSVTSVPR